MDTWQQFVLGGMLGVLVWCAFEIIALLRGIEKRLGYANELLSSTNEQLSSISLDTAFLVPTGVTIERAKQAIKALGDEKAS